ncbi:MAG TPA: elongation factor G [Phycisphaerae bacterium]|nr:elongation factor G [Phycisphaerae bacterium]
MPVYDLPNLRNIALIGHAGSGKTSLAEAMLHKTGATNRLGSVTDGTSILDFADDEKEASHSIDSAMCYVTHQGKHINIVDTPGGTDFCGQAVASLAGVETGILVLSASAGIEVNSRKMMERAAAYGLARMIVINKIDSENINIEELVDTVKEFFGPACVPINLPTGKGSSVIDCTGKADGTPDFGDVAAAHEAALEAVVGADDALMEKYLGGEATDEEIMSAAAKACAAGEIIPILFTNARKEVGVDELLAAIVKFGPSPKNGKHRVLVTEDGEQEIEPSKDGPFVGQVFKVASDPKSNIKYSFIRVHSGQMASDGTIKTLRERKGMRLGHVNRFMGAEHKDEEAASAGDIIAVAKLDLHIGDVVYTDTSGTIEMPKLPKPMYALALESKSRGDEDKVGGALKRFSEEDPCFQMERDNVTHELVIHGVGDVHVRTLLKRMQRQYKLEVATKPPKIPYRETISGRADNIEYTHKKQSGGAGQFGRVIINMYPSERGAGYEFLDKIFGGAIDQPFRVSTDKGIRAQMVEGVLAGYPVVDVTVELIDGKTHPVDSKDIAFQIAGRGAFKEGFMKAKPVLLEPIVEIEVTVPRDAVGDIQGDLASRRGRPQGQDGLPGGLSVIRALVPLAEIADYNSRLSSITGGQGSYSIEFSHYEPVPPNIQQQIIQQHQQEASAAS